ncbi:MAG: AAA family ATPase [Candidatus Cloacimonadaceae bacterium]|jgi:AAA15 family ATPase/GTPase
MIITFSAQNFRSIRDKITLDFNASSDKHLEEYFVYEIPKPKLRILRMGMIYGANASGKTNVLMALKFIQQVALLKVDDKDKPIAYLPFALDNEKSSTFEIEFYHEGIVYFYKVELTNERILSESLDYYPRGRAANVFQRNYNHQKGTYQYKWTYRGYSRAVQNSLELTIRNQSILATIASIEAQGPLQHARDWFATNLLLTLDPKFNLNKLIMEQISNNRISKDFILSSVKTADLMISDYDLVQVDSPMGKWVLLMIEHSGADGNFTLELNDQSSGTQRFFGLTAFLNTLIRKPVTMPIDEIDSSLHHDLVTHFLYMFLQNSKAGQLIFTTHNQSLLGEKDIARRDCIWITERKKDGSTKLSNVWDNYPVRKEHSIESLYKKGFLGGKPFLGSIHIEVNDGEKA